MGLIRKQRTADPEQDKAREELAQDVVREIEKVYRADSKYAPWFGRFSPNSAGTPETSKMFGSVRRVTRVAQGHYRVYLETRFKRLLSWLVAPTVTTTTQIYTSYLYEDQSNARDPYVGVLTKSAGVQTDFSNAHSVCLNLLFEVT